jgi:AcrR family transcriptional regulator
VVQVRARRRLGVDERRAMLLELGLRLFGARGPDDVSVEDIAREAGVSAGLLYHYFGSKREFHQAVTAHAIERLALVTAPDLALPPGQRLVSGLVRYLEYVRTDAGGWSWLLRGGAAGDEHLAALSERYRESVVAWVFDALPLAAQTPVSRLAVLGWIGSNTEMAIAWLAGEGPDRVVVVRLMVAVLVAALAEAGVDAGVVTALRADADVALTALAGA